MRYRTNNRSIFENKVDDDWIIDFLSKQQRKKMFTNYNTFPFAYTIQNKKKNKRYWSNKAKQFSWLIRLYRTNKPVRLPLHHPGHRWFLSLCRCHHHLSRGKTCNGHITLLAAVISQLTNSWNLCENHRRCNDWNFMGGYGLGRLLGEDGRQDLIENKNNLMGKNLEIRKWKEEKDVIIIFHFLNCHLHKWAAHTAFMYFFYKGVFKSVCIDWYVTRSLLV